MVSCSDACWFLAAANCNSRPHASRRPEAQPSSPSAICDMRYGWTPRGPGLKYRIPSTGCCHGGAEPKMQSTCTENASVVRNTISKPYLTPWRLVMRATLLCCVAHTGPCMEYMCPHMPLKQGAYSHVRIRYVLRARTVAVAPYIGTCTSYHAASLLWLQQRSAVSLYIQHEVNSPCCPPKRGDPRAKLFAGQSVVICSWDRKRVDGRSGRQEGPNPLFAFGLFSLVYFP
jgi:hypothetical protein